MFPFDIASKQAQIQKYEEEINKQDFWDDNEKAQKILQQNSDLKNIISEFEGLNSDLCQRSLGSFPMTASLFIFATI